jgi:hypothetical protein
VKNWLKYVLHVSKLFKWISLSCRKTFPYILYSLYLLFHNELRACIDD